MYHRCILWSPSAMTQLKQYYPVQNYSRIKDANCHTIDGRSNSDKAFFPQG